MRRVHLLLGDPRDSCCAGVHARLTERGLAVQIVASPLTPPGRFAWRLDDDGPTSWLELDGGPVEVEGVLVRAIPWLDPTGWAPADHAYMQAELLAATLAWLATLPCPVVNRPSAETWYRGGASLLAWRPLLRRCGLEAPEQLITNDPADARSFGRQLANAGRFGAVYTPLTSDANYLVASDAAWHGIAELQDRSPVCLTEPHGPALPACVVGREVIWDQDPPPETRALEPRLLALAAAADAEFLEVVTAPLRDGPGVVFAERTPVLEHFSAPTRVRILDALAGLFLPVTATPDAVS